MIFVTSDEHFEHANVINFCHRPFANVDEMREKLIHRHNSRVKAGDLVYHLGDMFWKTCSEAQALDIMNRLNGNHYYINGNHEEVMQKSPKLRGRFVWVKDISRLHSTSDADGKPFTPRIVLFHYAMMVWEGSHRGDWQLYGHSHGELSKGVPDAAVAARLNSFDVGVDCWDYYPISIHEVKREIERKQVAAGWTMHSCPACQHKFYNYNKLDEICVKCLTRMAARENGSL